MPIGCATACFDMCHRCGGTQAQQFDYPLMDVQELRVNDGCGREILHDRSEFAVCAGHFCLQRDLHAIRRESLAFHIMQCFCVHALDHLAYLSLSFYGCERNVEAMLVDVNDIRDGRAERTKDRSRSKTYTWEMPRRSATPQAK